MKPRSWFSATFPLGAAILIGCQKAPPVASSSVAAPNEPMSTVEATAAELQRNYDTSREITLKIKGSAMRIEPRPGGLAESGPKKPEAGAGKCPRACFVTALTYILGHRGSEQNEFAFLLRRDPRENGERYVAIMYSVPGKPDDFLHVIMDKNGIITKDLSGGP